MPLPKPCKRCGRKFTPRTSSGKLCEKCMEKSRQVIIDKNKKRGKRIK